MSCLLLDIDQRRESLNLSIMAAYICAKGSHRQISNPLSSSREAEALAGFKQLLLAIDLSPESDALVGRVLETCQDDLSNLRVVHVIKESLHCITPDSFSSVSNTQAQRIKDHTLIRIREVLHRNGLAISSDRIHLVCGEPAFEIKKLAVEINADLVIVGSHSKEEDWLHLPGTTTNCVIQGISSDVIAVKV